MLVSMQTVNVIRACICMIGIESYTTSTTNMHKQRLHVLVRHCPALPSLQNYFLFDFPALQNHLKI